MPKFFITSLPMVCTLICATLVVPIVGAEEKLDPSEIMLGERLFLETRFAQYFNLHLDQAGKINRAVTKGDASLNKTTRFSRLPPYQIPFAVGPFAGKTFSCRACHLVDEHVKQQELGMRSYADFAPRSPLPTRDDGLTTTVRNAPALVDVSLPRENFLLHFDGEFSSLAELVRGTLTNGSVRVYCWFFVSTALSYQIIKHN